jgi:hypothetical protein
MMNKTAEISPRLSSSVSKFLTLGLLLTMAPPALALFGGTTAASGELPATLRLGFGRDGVSKVCTGTRIGPRMVLTAAHCFGELTWQRGWECVDLGGQISVRNSATRDVSLRVEGIHIHPDVSGTEPIRVFGQSIPDFDGKPFYDKLDLAIVEFSQDLPATFPTSVISYAAVSPRTQVWMGGFGQTSLENPAYPVQMKKAAVAVLNNRARKFEFGVPDEIFLLHGDSGGPVYNRSTMEVVGVNSMIEPGRRELRNNGPRDYYALVGYKSLATPMTGMRSWVQRVLSGSPRPDCRP